MLNMMRGAISGWTAKILLGLLVLSFAVWGIGDVFRGGSVSTVLTAGKTNVSLQQYALAYTRAQSAIAQQLGQRPTPEQMQMFGIDQGILSQLVSGAVLQDQGRRMGLGLSQDRLAQLIASDPAFHDGAGNFSRSNFRNALANAGINEATYIRSQEDQALQSQLVDAVSQGVKTPKAFDRAMGLYNGTRRTIDYIVLTPQQIPAVEDPTQDQLAEYFQSHKQSYAAPEYRTIEYAVVSPEAMADPSTVSDAQVKADYEQYKSRYTTPAKRRVEQIVFSDQEAADAARTKLDGGASFEEVARDAGKSLSDIDLGLVTKAQIPDAKLADAAFSLADGEVSKVVDGTFGPAILKVTQVQKESVQPLSDVADQIRKQIALENAADASSTAYNAFEDARAGGASFAEAAKTAAIAVKTTPKVDQSGNGTDGKPVDLPAKQDLLSQAFQSEQGYDNVPVNDQSNGYVFYNVTNVDPARERSLDEVKDKVVADWKAAEVDKRLIDKASFLRSEVAAGNESLDQVAKDIGVDKEVAPSVTRQSGAADLGQAGITAAFEGGPGTVASAPGRESGTQLVLQVAEVAPPADPNASVSSNERQQMNASFQDDLLRSYVELLQNTTPIAIHPQGIEQAKAMVR